MYICIWMGKKLQVWCKVARIDNSVCGRLPIALFNSPALRSVVFLGGSSLNTWLGLAFFLIEV